MGIGVSMREIEGFGKLVAVATEYRTLRHMPMALMTLDVVGARRVGVNAGWYQT
jgi:hypothetical protein